MKKSILIFALSLIFAVSYGQSEKRSESNESLTPFELQISKGGFIIPAVKANFYFSDKTILRVTSPNVKLSTFRPSNYKNNFDVGVFLEFRKKSKKWPVYFSTGPAIGYNFDRNLETEEITNTFRAGYNFGVGTHIGNHITAGTYINPYVSYDGDSFDILHGRFFVGSLTNLYIAYRF